VYRTSPFKLFTNPGCGEAHHKNPTLRLLVSSYFGFFFCSKTCEASLMKTVNPYLEASG
jgi:hypothetical protein